MKKSFVPEVPRNDDFTFIYNGKEAHISKYHFALYSAKFRRIPEFYIANTLTIQDNPQYEIFCQFLRASQGMEVNIKVDNAIDILHFCDVWEVDSVASDVKKLINNTAELNKAIQKILYSNKKKDFNTNLEDLIANNIDIALQINSLADFPLQTLIRIFNNPNCIIKKQHRYYRFVKQMLNKIGSDASLLASKIDFMRLSSDECIELLRHPKLIKSYVADSLVDMSVSLLQDNAKYIGQITDYRNQINQINQRISFLEQSTPLGNPGNSDSIKQINKKIVQIESKFRLDGDEKGTDADSKIADTLSKIDQLVNDAISNMNKSYKEVEQKAHKNVRKTNKIVNTLTKKSVSIENEISSLKSENSELKNSVSSLYRKLIENEESIVKLKKQPSSSPKQIVAQFSGQPYNGIFAKLKESSDSDPYLKKIVSITASTRDRNETYQIIDYGWNDFFFTQDKPNSWILFDFKDMKIHLTNYTLKTHKYPSGTCHIKSWVIEGSNGNNNWVEIDKRSTPVLNGPNRFQTFPATKSNETFKLIRLRQTGYNFRNDNILAIANVEFFGTIYLT